MFKGSTIMFRFVVFLLASCALKAMEANDKQSVEGTCDASNSSCRGSLRIAFFGNSHTFYNDLPHLVQSVLSEGYEGQSVIVGACLRGESSLRTIWERGSTENEEDAIGGHDMYPTPKALLEEPSGWDVVVFQASSSRPDSSLKELYIPALLKMKTTPIVMLYQTWGFHEDDFLEVSKQVAKGMPLYADLFARAGIETITAPVGDAFVAVHESARDWWPQLYYGDDVHASGLGSFLSSSHIAASLVNHSRFAEQFPRGLRIQPVWPQGIRTHFGEPPSQEELAQILKVAHLGRLGM
jgi:hypothetical protein